MSSLGVYAAEPTVLLYLFAAFVVGGFGAGVFLFERFRGASRRYFYLTSLVALWLVPLGLATGAPGEATEQAFLRLAYVLIPFTVPVLYGLGRAMMVQPTRFALPPAALVWGLAATFALTSAFGPWLVEGLQSLIRDRTLTDRGWLGALYIVFEIVGLTGSLLLVLASRRGAMTGEEEQERAILGATALVALMPYIDYVLADDPFRAGPVTPVALVVGVLIATSVAIRYRVFATPQTFGTGEVLRAMADAVLVCDPLGRIRSANPAARAITGRSETQLVGCRVGEVLGRKEHDAWTPWEELDESVTEELSLRAEDGRAVRVQASIEPIRFGARAAGAVIVARDIRKQLRTQRALEASQRRYQSLFWHNPAMLYEYDLDGRLTAVNPAMEKMLGVPAAELRGRPILDSIVPGDRAAARQIYEHVIAGEAREYELTALTSNGDRRRLRGVSIPIFEGPEVTGVFGVALDVTEQNRIKQELEVQRRYFADLFNSSPEGIVLLDPRTDEILRVNDEFTRMFGYDGHEVLGRRLTELIVPEDRAEEGRELNQRAREEGQVRADTVRRRKDGSLLEVSVLARDLRIPGEPRQLFGVYRDISARKAAERALQEREEELRHAQRLEAVGKLAGGIAHDFNNLLTVINGQAQFALENVSRDCLARDELREIERAGSRAASLTQQLLAFSRRQMLRPEVLDLNTVIRNLEGLVRRLIGEHIRMETRFTAEEARIRADRGQVEQVAINLAVNARDAMPEGGTLEVATEVFTLAPDDDRIARWNIEPGDYVRLRVVDDGMGMEPETLDHAFEPFFTTKEQGKGTGLGLATVFGIVKQSGGHVTARSAPDEGTEVEVWLPRCRDEVTADPHHDPHENGVCPGGTILVVEDEDAVRKLVVKALEREGCTVLAAENGVRALEMADAHPGGIDLVITDLVMPTMGGRELALKLRDRRPELPILFVSGYDDAPVERADGDTDFMTKPFTPSALVDRVATVLGR
ncbi:MAG: PAS domain S-box protein [Longimicrobiales bacterium]|nr:PAS domain S-box protein [Longimicrobiales bacterium]